ncbi:MAG: hypothetical protein ACT4P7_06795 [Gemmatimonadaceae bacterium]
MPNEPTRPGDAPPPATVAPASLDREALERVLARAAELNAGLLEPAEGMTEGQLVELGKEVGISSEHIRQALAEERTRVAVPETRGIVGELFGASSATASRIVSGTPAALLAQLDQWMQREEALRPKRRFADRLTWEARRDFMGNLQVNFNFSGRAYALNRATEVGATIVAVDGQRSLVRLDADYTAARRSSVGWSSGFAGVGAVSAATLLGWSATIPGSSFLLAGLVAGGWSVVGGGVAYAISRSQRRRIERAQLALEQILDRLEHGEMQRSGNALSALFSAITR